jgi:hypothetical protein
MERKILEESWRRNGPAGPSLEVADDEMYKEDVTWETSQHTA